MKTRENCENRETCGRTGHLIVEGKAQRCPCMEREINQRLLGTLHADKPVLATPLIRMLKEGKNLVFTDSLSSLRPHLAGALIHAAQDGQTWTTIDAYRLIEIFLNQDQEYETTAAATGGDLLILMIGFADPPNRYLPELILQAINRRDLLQKPTWVVLGLPLEVIPSKYSQVLKDRLDSFLKARVA